MPLCFTELPCSETLEGNEVSVTQVKKGKFRLIFRPFVPREGLELMVNNAVTFNKYSTDMF